MHSFLQCVKNGGSEYPNHLIDGYIKGCSHVSPFKLIRALYFS